MCVCTNICVCKHAYKLSWLFAWGARTIERTCRSDLWDWMFDFLYLWHLRSRYALLKFSTTRKTLQKMKLCKNEILD